MLRELISPFQPPPPITQQPHTHTYTHWATGYRVPQRYSKAADTDVNDLQEVKNRARWLVHDIKCNTGNLLLQREIKSIKRRCKPSRCGSRVMLPANLLVVKVQ